MSIRVESEQKDRIVILQHGKEYYTVNEVAEVLNVTRASVHSYITNNIIKAELINGRRMVSKDALCRRLSELSRKCIYSFAFTEADV